MVEKNLVSIIIPAYNAEKFIKETVLSVVNQTYKNMELIIVNDGSTDNTLQIINSLKNSDDRITVINKSNSGVCDSRNAGIKKAVGSFYKFLDADDILDYSFLENCLSKFSSDESVQTIYTKTQLINHKSEKLDEFIQANTIRSVEDILNWKEGFVASPGCIIYRSSIIEKVGFFDSALSTAADQDFHLRVASIAPIEAIDKVLFYYRIHENNMHKNIAVMEKDHLYVFKKASRNKLFKSFWFKQKCFSNLYWILAGSWWKNGNNRMRGLYFIILALFANPFSIGRIFKSSIK